ncbi:hypothetical protein JCM11641_007769 [Rhodosporidiobolus odoratus]
MPVRTVFDAEHQPKPSPTATATSPSVPPSTSSKPLEHTPTSKQSPAKRSTLANGSSASAKPSRRPKVHVFDEEAEEEAKLRALAALNGHDEGGKAAASNGNGTQKGKAGKKWTNEEKKKAREEAKRLENSRRELPVFAGKDAILKGIEENDTVIVLGETGSGKTTQIPQFLLHSSVSTAKPRIVCTQPRRVAAISLASRVSAEVGTQIGGLVGYTVRFDDRTCRATRLKYATDGALLAEMLADCDLNAYEVVILDEAHERSLRTDMLMGFLKEIQKRRKEKIVVMSATIDAKRFSEFFNDAPVLFVQGRQHNVTLNYAQTPQPDYLDAALKTVFQIHTTYMPGSILVFLPGQEEIESLNASIRSYAADLEKSYPNKGELIVTPLYAKLPASEQQKAFELPRPNQRRVILSTNVAETSVTIPGVKFVVDCGLAKEKRYHGGTGIDSLMVESISQSSAKQRMGRAGREADGYCFRLYTERDYLALEKRTQPEIKRVSLTFALLHLMAAGQEDVWSFQYMDRPDKDAIVFALLTLHGLDALSPKGRITPLGLQMASLPLDPIYARVLLSSFSEGCPKDIINLVALLGSNDQLLINNSATRDLANAARSKFIHRSGDHLMLLNILRAYEELGSLGEKKSWCKENFVSFKAMNSVLDARKQLKERCERLDLGDVEVSVGESEEAAEVILGALVRGLFANTAVRMEDGTYRHVMTKQLVSIHPSSSLHNKKVPAIVYNELVLTTKTYARGVSSIPPEFIRKKAPNVFNSAAAASAS